MNVIASKSREIRSKGITAKTFLLTVLIPQRALSLSLNPCWIGKQLLFSKKEFLFDLKLVQD